MTSRSALPIGLFLAALAVQAVVWTIVPVESVQAGLRTVIALTPLPYNTALVLMGTGILGLTCGVVGSFAVLRQRALLGDAVAHAALPGLCITFLLIGQRNFTAFLIGAALSGLLGAWLISWLRANTRIKGDAAIGIVLSVFFGAGIALSGIIQHDPSGTQAGLDGYLLGKTAGLVAQDLLLIAVAGLNAILVVLLFYKEFKLLSFDQGFCTVQGWPAVALDVLMMGALVTVTVIGLPAVGVVLMAAMLIIPGVAARFWTNNLETMLKLAGVIGFVSAIVGTVVSSEYADIPTGPVIVLTAAAACIISMLVAPKRGVISRMLERKALTEKVARQNLLRTMYELSEEQDAFENGVSIEGILERRSWSKAEAEGLLRDAVRRGDAAGQENLWRLTDAGIAAAVEVVRAHRLWEVFLVEQADVAPNHVDRDADEIEHFLPKELLGELEERLKQEGRLPEKVPVSVHPTTEGVAP